MRKEIDIDGVCEWMVTHDQGLDFIRLITEERDNMSRMMDKADDTALRKLAGGMGVIQGWIDQFEERMPKADGD